MDWRYCFKAGNCFPVIVGSINKQYSHIYAVQLHLAAREPGNIDPLHDMHNISSSSIKISTSESESLASSVSSRLFDGCPASRIGSGSFVRQRKQIGSTKGRFRFLLSADPQKIRHPWLTVKSILLLRYEMGMWNTLAFANGVSGEKKGGRGVRGRQAIPDLQKNLFSIAFILAAFPTYFLLENGAWSSTP